MIFVEGGRRPVTSGRKSWDVRGSWAGKNQAGSTGWILFGPSPAIRHAACARGGRHSLPVFLRPGAAVVGLGSVGNGPRRREHLRRTWNCTVRARGGRAGWVSVCLFRWIAAPCVRMTTPGPLDLLRKDLDAMRGQAVLVSTTSSGWQQGKDAAPHQDWVGQRVGARIPEANQVLRSDAGRAVLGACGVPPELFEGNTGSGQGAREGYRRFVFGSVQPVAALGR